jgi:hypothetical protein
MTPAQAIRAKVEARLNREFIEHFFDIAVHYHSRKGLRPDCSCRHCVHKRGHTHAMNWAWHWERPELKRLFRERRMDLIKEVL